MERRHSRRGRTPGSAGLQAGIVRPAEPGRHPAGEPPLLRSPGARGRSGERRSLRGRAGRRTIPFALIRFTFHVSRFTIRVGGRGVAPRTRALKDAPTLPDPANHPRPSPGNPQNPWFPFPGGGVVVARAGVQPPRIPFALIRFTFHVSRFTIRVGGRGVAPRTRGMGARPEGRAYTPEPATQPRPNPGNPQNPWLPVPGGGVVVARAGGQPPRIPFALIRFTFHVSRSGREGGRRTPCSPAPLHPCAPGGRGPSSRPPPLMVYP